jgi:LysM repeat protein
VARTPGWRRYAGPAAFLAAATIAVLLVRAGLHSGANHAARGGHARPTSPAAATTTVRRPVPRFWTVRAGDTFETVATRTGVTIATIQRLNPGVRSTSLFIGQKLRLR